MVSTINKKVATITKVVPTITKEVALATINKETLAGRLIMVEGVA